MNSNKDFNWDELEDMSKTFAQYGVDINYNQASNSKPDSNKAINTAPKDLLKITDKTYTLEVTFLSEEKGKTNSSEFLLQRREDEVALRKFFTLCQKFISIEQLSLNSLAQDGTLVVKDVVKTSKEGQEVLLTPLEPYQLLPSDVDFIFYDGSERVPAADYDKLMLSLNTEKLQIKSKTIIGKNSRMNKTLNTLDEKINRTRLKKMLRFMIDQPIPHYNMTDINTFKELLRKNCAGIDYYAELIHSELARTLTTSVYDKPKGILFYGPPRTGKTHVSREMIKYLNLFRVTEDLAAGDFCKPLVGQSEQMINTIAARCDVLPWELCTLFIDEIDSLCPKRNSGNTSSGKIDLISVFLSLMDGNKKKKNLMIIGTSNRLKQMDDAFLQRMDIKLFIGLPNSLARVNWVQRIVEMTKEELVSDLDSQPGLKPEYITLVKSCMNNMRVLDSIQNFTINFTADAMKKSISQVMTDLVNFDKYYKLSKEKLEEQIIPVIFENLNRICINDKIFISSQTPPSLVRDIEGFCIKEQFNHELWKKEWWHCLTPQRSKNYSGRMLIDLKESQEEQFQIEIDGRIEINKAHYEIMDELFKLKARLANLNGSDQAKYLVELFNRFLKVFDFYALMIKQNDLAEIKKHPSTILRFFEYFVDGGGFENLVKDTKKSILFGLAGKDNPLSSREEALKILVKMGQMANMNFIVVIDAAYFIKLGIMRDDAIAEEIVMVYEEAIQYDSCLVIFDLDSIADVTKEYNELQEDISISSAKAFKEGKNDAGFTYTLNKKQAFRAALECLKLGSGSMKNHWFVALSDNNKLTLDFKEKLKWPPSQKQLLQEKNILSHNESQRCVYCLEYFTEKTNEPNSCGRHLTEYLYDQDFINKIIELKKNESRSVPYDPFEDSKLNPNLYKKTAQEVREMLKSEKEGDIRKAGNYVWFCCGKKLYEKGEYKHKHSTQFK